MAAACDELIDCAEFGENETEQLDVTSVVSRQFYGTTEERNLGCVQSAYFRSRNI